MFDHFRIFWLSNIGRFAAGFIASLPMLTHAHSGGPREPSEKWWQSPVRPAWPTNSSKRNAKWPVDSGICLRYSQRFHDPEVKVPYRAICERHIPLRSPYIGLLFGRSSIPEMAIDFTKLAESSSFSSLIHPLWNVVAIFVIFYSTPSNPSFKIGFAGNYGLFTPQFMVLELWMSWCFTWCFRSFFRHEILGQLMFPKDVFRCESGWRKIIMLQEILHPFGFPSFPIGP